MNREIKTSHEIFVHYFRFSKKCYVYLFHVKPLEKLLITGTCILN